MIFYLKYALVYAIEGGPLQLRFLSFIINNPLTYCSSPIQSGQCYLEITIVHDQHYLRDLLFFISWYLFQNYFSTCRKFLFSSSPTKQSWQDVLWIAPSSVIEAKLTLSLSNEPNTLSKKTCNMHFIVSWGQIYCKPGLVLWFLDQVKLCRFVVELMPNYAFHLQ